MPATCDMCGKETKVEEAYYKILVEHRTTKEIRRRCPECWLKSQKRGFQHWVITYSVVALVGIGLTLSGFRAGWVFINLVVFYIFFVLAALPHELGHAFAAKAVGFRSFYAVIGFGKLIFERPLCGFTFQLRSIPLGGFAFSTAKDTVHYKLKRSLTIIAGPLANLFLGILLLILFPNATLDFDFKTGPKPANLLFIANIVQFLCNIWPHTTRGALGELPSDGLYFWRTIFLSRDKIEKMPCAYFLYEGGEQMKRGRFEQAGKYYEDGLKKFPDDADLLNARGTWYIYSKQFSRAREDFRALLQRSDMNWYQRSLQANNIAYVDALIGGEELIQEADKYSTDALECMPSNPYYKGTRGFVLIELGKYDEGIRLLKEAMEWIEEPKGKALDACCIAIAEKRRGNLEESQKFASVARSLDPNCMLLDRLA